jgi:hypothetical protein
MQYIEQYPGCFASLCLSRSREYSTFSLRALKGSWNWTISLSGRALRECGHIYQILHYAMQTRLNMDPAMYPRDTVLERRKRVACPNATETPKYVQKWPGLYGMEPKGSAFVQFVSFEHERIRMAWSPKGADLFHFRSHILATLGCVTFGASLATNPRRRWTFCEIRERCEKIRRAAHNR